jgi:hypothetical protein
MWFRRLKRLFVDPTISDAQISADDRFELRLQELFIAQQHYSLFQV